MKDASKTRLNRTTIWNFKSIKIRCRKNCFNKRSHWICSCEECGEEHSIRTDTLKKIQHCPINAHRGVNIKNEVENVYGKLKVIEQDTTRINNNQNAFWFVNVSVAQYVVLMV